MQDSLFVKELRAFSETASIDASDIDFVFNVRIIASFIQINKQAVLEDVLRTMPPSSEHMARVSAQDVDWGGVAALLNSEMYSNSSQVAAFWLRFLSFVDFVDEPVPTEEMQQYLLKAKRRMPLAALPSYSPIDAVRVALTKSLPVDAAITWTKTCKTFLIMNVVQEDPATAVSALLQDCAPSVRDDVGAQVARHLLGFRNSPAEHQETLTTLLTTYMNVRRADMRKLLESAAATATLVTAGVQATFLQRLRPSLTGLAQAHISRAVAVAREEENFASFAQACRFPLNMSGMLQRYIYFLKTLDDPDRHIDTQAFVELVVLCPILLRNVKSVPVVRVDVPAVLGILAVARNVGDPSAQIKKFRAVCVDPFMSRQRARFAVNWTIVLKLYLAAFTRPVVRHECWKEVVQRNEFLQWDSACTAEALQAVDAFVDREPFDAAFSLRMLEQSVKAVESQR